MKAQIAVGLAAFASIASAHTVFTNFLVDDVNQGDGTCVRMPKDPDTCTDPIDSIDSDDMACGKDGENAVAFNCPASSGSKMTFTFREWADGSNPGSIDSSHKGPCAVYLKAVDDMSSDAAAGGGWFKIWDEGFDESAQQWCTEKLIDNAGLLSVNLPDGIPTGYYLVRPELLALQESDKGDPQFYVGCAQVYVTGTSQGSLQIPEEYLATIPGYLTASDESLTFNIYANPMALPYAIPGPQPFSLAAQSAPTQQAAQSVQTQGEIPDTCLLKNANWCGVEVPEYSDEDGCWSASEDCFQQQAACYDSAPPTGSKGCDAWGNKCTAIQNACAGGDWNGPPDAGQKLDDVNVDVPGPIPPAAPAATGSATSAAQDTGAGDAKGAILLSQTPATEASKDSGSCRKARKRRARTA